jgi:phage terminase large subunit-like protein
MSSKKNFVFKPKPADPELIKLGIHCNDYRYNYAELAEQLNDYRLKGRMDDYYGLMRDIGKNDLFFFSYFVLSLPIAHPFLVARFYNVQDECDKTIDLWARGHWKAIDVNEPILTPSGWRKHGELEPGDEVYGGDGFPVKVKARTPIFYDALCYKVTFDDGYSVIASEDHLWTVEKRTRKRDFYKRMYRETVIMSTKEVLQHGFLQDKRLSVWIVPVEHAQKELPIDPYTFGAWLGDGHSACGRITNMDSEVWQGVGKLNDITSYSKPLTKNIIGLHKKLRLLGVKDNKYIPEIYLMASIEQRTRLLQGLMDTDGTVDKRGTATFCNTNERLAENVFELCTSLGLKPFFRKHVNRKLGISNYTFYNVSFQAYSNSNIFTISRKKERCFSGIRNTRKFIINAEPVKSIPVSCIEVENDGNYLVGKHLTLTHNSTSITFARTLWDITRNPDERFCIFSHTRKMAKDHARVLMHAMEANENLHKAYPEIFYDNPRKDSPKWSEDIGLFVKRSLVCKEPTIYASGLVDGLPVGFHFTKHIYDDIIDVKNVQTALQIQKAETMFSQSQFLLEPDGEQRVVGTRYHTKDIYGKLIGTRIWKPRIFPAEVDENGEAQVGGRPVYLSRADLDSKRAISGDYEYSAQMLQNPTAVSSQNFKMYWLKYYTDLPIVNKYILCDAASSKKKGSDYTVMAVIGLDSLRNYYLVDCVRDKLGLKEKWDRLTDLCRRHNLNQVFYEQYGAMADKDYFEEQMQIESFYFSIEILKGTVSKFDRIGRLMPIFSGGRFYLPKSLLYKPTDGSDFRDLVEDFLAEEYSRYPFAKNDDMLDCFARILEHNVNATPPAIQIEKLVEKKPYDPLDMESLDSHGTWMSV